MQPVGLRSARHVHGTRTACALCTLHSALCTLRAVHACTRLVDAGERHVLVRGCCDAEDVGRQLPVARPVVLEHAVAAVDGEVLEGVDRHEDRAHLVRARGRARV